MKEQPAILLDQLDVWAAWREKDERSQVAQDNFSFVRSVIAELKERRAKDAAVTELVEAARELKFRTIPTPNEEHRFNIIVEGPHGCVHRFRDALAKVLKGESP